MENISANHRLITEQYTANSTKVLNYISTRVSDRAEAENLAQDVWVRLLEYGKALSPDSILSLIYTVAANIVNDYLRRLYRGRNAAEDIMNAEPTEIADYSMESAIMAMDLARVEQRRVECLPQQRRTIYMMSRYEDMSVADIARQLSLSFRTVENHLRMGRRDVRDYMTGIAM